MKRVVAFAFVFTLQICTIAPGVTQTIAPLPCATCLSVDAAQQSVLQSQISQQQLSQNIQATLNTQQQSLSTQQLLNQLRLQAQLDQNTSSLQNILLQDQIQLLQLQLMRLKPPQCLSPHGDSGNLKARIVQQRPRSNKCPGG